MCACLDLRTAVARLRGCLWWYSTAAKDEMAGCTQAACRPAADTLARARVRLAIAAINEACKVDCRPVAVVVRVRKVDVAGPIHVEPALYVAHRRLATLAAPIDDSCSGISAISMRSGVGTAAILFKAVAAAAAAPHQLVEGL